MVSKTPQRRRPSSADLHIHRPKFDHCEPESPVEPPISSHTPPTLQAILSRARAQRRRAIREENYESVRRLDADIERLQNAQRQSNTDELPRYELDKLLAELDQEMMGQRKKQFFSDSPVTGGRELSGSELERRAQQLDRHLERMLAGHREVPSTDANARGWIWPTAASTDGHSLPMPTLSSGTFLQLEEQADQLDRRLERALGLPFARTMSPDIGNKHSRADWSSDSIGWSYLPLTRRLSPQGSLGHFPTPSTASIWPWESGHLQLLDQIRRFDDELVGIDPRQRRKWPSAHFDSKRRRRFKSQPATLQSPSPPIVSKHTAKWVQKQHAKEAAIRRRISWEWDSDSGNDSPFADGDANRRSSDSCWSVESPFAPPKGFYHQNKRKAEMPTDEDDSVQLLTPPELKDEGERSSAESLLLDRDQFLMEINPADRGFAARGVDLFGLDIMANVYAKHWAQRMEGIQQMTARLHTAQGQAHEMHMLDTAIPVVKRALQDSLFQVLFTGMALFAHLQLRLSAPSTDAEPRLQRKFAMATAHSLARMIGDRNEKRVAQLALETVERLFSPSAETKVSSLGQQQLPAIPQLANLFLLQLLGHREVAKHGHLELGQAKMVQHGVRRLWSTDASSCKEHRLCPFIGHCLDSPEPEIRHIGRQMAEWIYTHGTTTNRRLIRRLFPLPDEEDIKARARANFRQLVQLHDLWNSIDQPTHEAKA